MLEKIFSAMSFSTIFLLTSVILFPPVVAANPQSTQQSGQQAQPAARMLRPVILLDPGHSGKDIVSIDTKTGLRDHDYPNHPELEETFRVAKIVAAKLTQAGYLVVMAKEKAEDSVSLKERAEVAIRKKAWLGVSIHDDHGQQYSSFAEVYPQRVGQWRGGTQNKPKAKFTNARVAQESESFAKIFAQERSQAEGHKVAVKQNSFDGRPGIEPGNIPQVMLFAGIGEHPVPWVYNEVGGIGLDSAAEAQYAQGIFNAIVKCIPIAL